jgi:hypothetical protein
MLQYIEDASTGEREGGEGTARARSRPKYGMEPDKHRHIVQRMCNCIVCLAIRSTIFDAIDKSHDGKCGVACTQDSHAKPVNPFCKYPRLSPASPHVNGRSSATAVAAPAVRSRTASDQHASVIVAELRRDPPLLEML